MRIVGNRTDADGLNYRPAHSFGNVPLHATPSIWQARVMLASTLLVTLTASTIAASDTRPSEIWVVTDRQHPVSVPAGIRLIELDAPARIQMELSQNLPADREHASAIARERLQNSDFRQRLLIAFQSVTDAWGAGIIKIPAVVIDRRFVVYGDTDVGHACSLIGQYRKAHP
jgi:integrating conjugative element protein (TIGR03757 family)